MPENIRNQLPQIVVNFANFKDVIQGCSKKTVTEYMFDLRTFCRFMKAQKYGLPMEGEDFDKIEIRDLDTEFFSKITTSDIYDFLSYVGSERENNARARARKLSAIKQFYKYCTAKMMLFENNPAQIIETPKTPKTLPKHLTLDECKELLNSVVEDETSKTRERDYCILTLFLNRTYTGRAVRAVSDDKQAAMLSGINVKKVYAAAMGVSTATAAAAGLCVGMKWTFYPSSGGQYLLIAFIVVAIGGMGSIPGTMLAGILFGLAQVVGGANYGLMISYVFMLAAMALRPGKRGNRF